MSRGEKSAEYLGAGLLAAVGGLGDAWEAREEEPRAPRQRRTGRISSRAIFLKTMQLPFPGRSVDSLISSTATRRPLHLMGGASRLSTLSWQCCQSGSVGAHGVWATSAARTALSAATYGLMPCASLPLNHARGLRRSSALAHCLASPLAGTSINWYPPAAATSETNAQTTSAVKNSPASPIASSPRGV